MRLAQLRSADCTLSARDQSIFTPAVLSCTCGQLACSEPACGVTAACCLQPAEQTEGDLTLAMLALSMPSSYRKARWGLRVSAKL